MVQLIYCIAYTRSSARLEKVQILHTAQCQELCNQFNLVNLEIAQSSTVSRDLQWNYRVFCWAENLSKTAKQLRLVWWINSKGAVCNLFKQLNGVCIHSTGCCVEPIHLMYLAAKTRYVNLQPKYQGLLHLWIYRLWSRSMLCIQQGVLLCCKLLDLKTTTCGF